LETTISVMAVTAAKPAARESLPGNGGMIRPSITRDGHWIMNTNEAHTGVRELTLTELDHVSGGAKNSDDPRVQAFLKGYEDAIKKHNAELLELARSSGGSLGSSYTPL
jgi:hypothetical protein